MEALQPVLQHRAVNFLQYIDAHFDLIISIHRGVL